MGILDTITPNGIKTINDGIQGLFDPLNPLVTTINTNKNKEIASFLVKNDFTVQEIKDFVDISRVQLDPYIAEQVLRHEIRKEILEEAKSPKTK